MRLKDKVIVVTGSTTGIGEAIARRFSQEGAKIVVHGRDQERAQKVANDIGSTAVHVDDLADPEAGQRLVATALESHGRIDGIVNNAAYVVRSTLDSTDVELFDRVMAINVRAPMLLLKAAHEELKKSSGAVLNIGSINAYCGEPNLLAYSISKGGLMTLSRNLADCLCLEGIRVNHFNVGWVLTPNEYHYKIADGLSEDWPEKVPRSVAPAGRLIKPEEVAAAAVYWISEESRPFNGTVLELEQYPIVGRNPLKEEND
ncbi:Glucose 1-dehydrogenase 2 [Planctomycetes bacterium Pan216]|uniref:Glucose 1-dehydrogenase 2 n=1 Tax=Kolteria novifilia TaxID=2527975 RepID=A0A518BCG1_9BACT|nr:Glucose 1-dehydrogenase 2 [Planctomycetes bacterium Pan216]